MPGGVQGDVIRPLTHRIRHRALMSSGRIVTLSTSQWAVNGQSGVHPLCTRPLLPYTTILDSSAL